MSSPAPCPAIASLLSRADERGMSVLSDAELLALLGAGPAASSADYRRSLAAAGDLLDGSASLAELLGCARQQAAGPLGDAAALALAAAAELGRRVRAGRLAAGLRLLSSLAVAEHFGPLLADELREMFYAVLVDTRNRVISKVRISEGSLGASLVHPREAFSHAVRAAAAAVVFVHNHPSGDPQPSNEDRRLTERLVSSGKLLGIPVLDHVVVGRTSHYSFADNGEIGRAGPL